MDSGAFLFWSFRKSPLDITLQTPMAHLLKTVHIELKRTGHRGPGGYGSGVSTVADAGDAIEISLSPKGITVLMDVFATFDFPSNVLVDSR